jgi:hypothetical protein
MTDEVDQAVARLQQIFDGTRRVQVFPKEYNKNLSVFEAEYLTRMFRCPYYPWEPLTPFWPDVALAIAKTLVYGNFSPDCVLDHHAWRNGKITLEALKFLDLLSRDRGFKQAVDAFNAEVGRLKYGNWLEVLEHDTVAWNSQIAQLGQFTKNSFDFLLKTGFLYVAQFELGVRRVKPYFIKLTDNQLQRQWLKETLLFFAETYKKKKRYPTLREISEFWGVSNETLIGSGFVYPVIVECYRHWRRYKTLKTIKQLRRTYQLLSEKDIPKIAKQIISRVKEN